LPTGELGPPDLLPPWPTPPISITPTPTASGKSIMITNPKGNPNWVKGHSANPSGKPKEYEGIAEMCRRWTPDIVRVFARIVKDSKQPAASRVSAGIALLDRGWGRPASFSTSDPADFKRATDMSDAELIKIARAGGIEIDVPREAKSPGDLTADTASAITH
jgi:hypothetical protein